jgi:hypothetical protein
MIFEIKIETEGIKWTGINGESDIYLVSILGNVDFPIKTRSTSYQDSFVAIEELLISLIKTAEGLESSWQPIAGTTINYLYEERKH